MRAAEPSEVMEFGAGIGTISQLLLEHSNGINHVTATENNAFCIDMLMTNFIAQFPGRFTLITDPKKLDLQRQYFDLVVIDGAIEPWQFGVLKRDTFCFVEGSRKATRKMIAKELRRRNLTIRFVDYNRGVRYFDWSSTYPNGHTRLIPKLKFRKIFKGCWVGQVSDLPRS